jgi:hypothetical protein
VLFLILSPVAAGLQAKVLSRNELTAAKKLTRRGSNRSETRKVPCAKNNQA